MSLFIMGDSVYNFSIYTHTHTHTHTHTVYIFNASRMKTLSDFANEHITS